MADQAGRPIARPRRGIETEKGIDPVVVVTGQPGELEAQRCRHSGPPDTSRAVPTSVRLTFGCLGATGWRPLVGPYARMQPAARCKGPDGDSAAPIRFEGCCPAEV